MEPIIREIINYMLIYVILIAIVVFVLNFLSKGYLFTLLRVRASRGKLILARIKSPTGFYFSTGTYGQGWFSVKMRSKETKRLEIDADTFSKFVFFSHGVAEVFTNEKLDVMVSKDLEVDMFVNQDPASNDILYQRIQNTPKKQSKNDTAVLILIVLIVILVGFLVARVMGIEKTLETLQTISGVIQ